MVRSVSRRLLRAALVVLFLIVIIGAIAPWVNAARYRARIRQALESSLSRRVDFDKVHFALFSGPGFSLTGVTIHEKPKYGIEPFAYVPTMRARVRIDRLLLGEIQFSSVRLVEPTLNLVKQRDGTWNIADLIDRFKAPRVASLNFFPAFEMSAARLNFKLGMRKASFYVAGSDISISPEPSNKLYIRFSGSPARTDRSGDGFGRIRGTANWYFAPPSADSNQLEANLYLDPTDVSELATLIEGYDVGVHGIASSRAHIEGPANALRVTGDLRLENVKRWDLLPGSAEPWRIGYRGNVDLLAHTLNLEAQPWKRSDGTQLAVEMRVNNFAAQPTWFVLAHVDRIPAQNLVPLCQRMGLTTPEGLALDGTVNGAIAYSNGSGLAGAIAIDDLVATLPGLPPMRAASATTRISPDSIHLNPTVIETASKGTLRVGGDYYPSQRRIVASFSVNEIPVNALNSSLKAWGATPSALTSFQEGDLSGLLTYGQEGTRPALWSGQLHFANATLNPPGLAVSLSHSEGRIVFDHSTLSIQHFTGSLGEQTIRADYSYNASLKHAEHLRLYSSSADLSQLDSALAPTLEPQGLLARLRLGRREMPAWLAARDLEADITVDQFSVNGATLGPLHSHLLWQGDLINLDSVRLNFPRDAVVSATGTVDLARYSPHFHFDGTVIGLPWKSGLVNADGTVETFGTGLAAVQNLHANGNFSGEDLALSQVDDFSAVSGHFDLSLDGGWPNLRLSKIQASDGEDAWIGEGVSQSDGKLVFDLESAGRQRRIVSTLEPETPAVSSSLATSIGSR